MEFDRQVDGRLNPLPAPSIDTGMGLERVTASSRANLSNYDTDLFTPLLSAIGERAARTHRGTMEPSDVSMRRRGGSHARDDVPHRRRRRAVQRMARLRAAEDHAARDAARETPGGRRAVPAHAGRRHRRRVRAAAYPG